MVPAGSVGLVRLVAGILLTAVIVALVVVRYVLSRHDPPPHREHPLEDWFLERPWRRYVLVLAVAAVSVALAIILIITVPPDSGAETIMRVAFLLVMIPVGILVKRDNRRKGLKAARPWTHGPPGWEWDPDAATWREPR